MLLDTSGLDALQQLHRTLKKLDIGLVLAHGNEQPQPLSLIRRSGFEAILGEDAIVPTVAGAFDARPLSWGPVALLTALRRTRVIGRSR